jgi:aldehyde:ferredoxin oxidoreductase
MNSYKFENIERYIEMYQKSLEPQIEIVEWDDLEKAYVDNLGNCYKTITEIQDSVGVSLKEYLINHFF